jgi:hypothetical protein
LLCFLDGSGEALAGMLRPGNAGWNTAADHVTVLEQAIAQLADAHRHGVPILIRTDSAGWSQAFLTVPELRERGLHTEFSVSVTVTEPVGRRSPPPTTGGRALNADSSLRDGARR